MKNFASPRFPSVRTVGVVSCSLLLLLSQAPNTVAQTVTLAPGDNSSVQVNTTGSGAGVVNWTVDGNNVLNSTSGGLQWFYYSIGAGTPAGVQNLGAASSSAVNYPTADTASFGTTYG